MTDAPEPPPKGSGEPQGAPGTELGLAGGNILALILTALGGWLVWVALAVAGGAVGLVVWRAQKRRHNNGHGTPARGSAARSSRPGRFGLSGGRGRSSSRPARGRLSGNGPSAGRSSGRRAGRKGTAATGPSAGSGRTRRPGRFGRLGKFGGKRRGGSDGGRKGAASTGRGTGRRLRSPSTWVRRGTSGGHGSKGSRGPKRANGRSSTRRPTTAGPNLHKADVINKPPAKKPAPATTKPPAPDTRTPTTNPSRAKRPVPNPYRSTTQPTTRHTKGTTIMAAIFGKFWRENAEETRSRAVRYDPEQMPDYLADLVDMAAAFELEAEALAKITAISEAELPVHPKLVDYLTQVGGTMRKVAGDTQDVVKHFMKLHQQDLDRHANGRRGEQKWNVK